MMFLRNYGKLTKTEGFVNLWLFDKISWNDGKTTERAFNWFDNLHLCNCLTSLGVVGKIKAPWNSEINLKFISKLQHKQ